jgi:hypothetical protein
MNSIDRGVFIRVLGAITDMIKSVIHQVLAGQLWSVAATHSRPRVPFHRLLESVTTKEAHRRLQSVASQLGSLAG